MTAPVIRVGDARDMGVLGLAAETVDCIITSPPYWHLKQYAEDDEREIGHQQTKQEYLDAVGEVFAGCFQLAKPTGVMWLVIDTLREPTKRGGPNELIPLPFELASAAREVGWRLQDVAIWEKNKTLPYSGSGKLRNLIEYIVFLTKSGDFKHRAFRCAERHRPGAEWLAGWPERYHPLGRRPANVWEYKIDTQGMWDHSAGLHACPFPQELVARFIDLTTDKADVVLDPFAGVGTVPAQAAAMGREGLGVELNPDNVKRFEEEVLPTFQASWEAGAEQRLLMRQDQLDEAILILKLRLLKAGKELVRVMDRLTTGRAAGHPAAEVESVLVTEPGSLASFVHVDEGVVDRVPARIFLVGDLNDARRQQLLDELKPVLDSPPFTTFGLEITLDVAPWTSLPRRGISPRGINQFAQSRHGAFTEPLDPRLFPSRPRLLTTVVLPTAIHGTKLTPLDEAKIEAERRILQRELATGADHATIAARLGLPSATLRELLLEHELVEKPRSFGISLPTDQLALT